MQKLGKRQLTLTLAAPMAALPEALAAWPLSLKAQGRRSSSTRSTRRDRRADIQSLLRKLGDLGVAFKDLQARQSSLEDIFVNTRAPTRGGGGKKKKKKKNAREGAAS